MRAADEQRQVEWKVSTEQTMDGVGHNPGERLESAHRLKTGMQKSRRGERCVTA